HTEPPPCFHWSLRFVHSRAAWSLARRLSSQSLSAHQVRSEESLPTGLPSDMVFSGSIRISSSGPVLNARQTSLPSLMLKAAIQQRTPNSAPEQPVNALSLTMCTALVLVSPAFGPKPISRPFSTFHTTLPSFALRATSVVSACCRKILPSA